MHVLIPIVIACNTVHFPYLIKVIMVCLTIEGRLIVGPFLCTLLNILTRILMYFRLFPMGDMPEILHSLIAKGRAILWSSQEKEGYQVR